MVVRCGKKIQIFKNFNRKSFFLEQKHPFEQCFEKSRPFLRPIKKFQSYYIFKKKQSFDWSLIIGCLHKSKPNLQFSRIQNYKLCKK